MRGVKEESWSLSLVTSGGWMGGEGFLFPKLLLFLVRVFGDHCAWPECHLCNLHSLIMHYLAFLFSFNLFCSH